MRKIRGNHGAGRTECCSLVSLRRASTLSMSQTLSSWFLLAEAYLTKVMESPSDFGCGSRSPGQVFMLSLCSGSREREGNGCWHHVFDQLKSLAHVMVPSTFRLGLPTSVKSFGNALKCVCLSVLAGSQD